MSYQDGLDAINLKMPNKVPRTEYSASQYWSLIKEVTGINVSVDSPQELKTSAACAFENAWNYGMHWSVLTHCGALDACRTKMGHASYAEGGVDFNNQVETPFEEPEEVLAFDPFKVYGVKDKQTLIKEYDAHYDKMCAIHTDQVNMTGIYITLVSGLIEIFGWEWLLVGLGEDDAAFGEVANRYADWILQYFEALAECKAPVVMIHDDIVWTDGAFADPKWYRKYVFPNYEKLFDPLKKAGKKILYTSDGNFGEFTDDIAACGINGFIMEPTTDMDYIAKKYGKTHAFVGNADTRILTFGTKDEIKKEVERCFDIGRECPGFFMAVGNHIPSNVPIENALYYNDIYEQLSTKR